jgi:lysozyme
MSDPRTPPQPPAHQRKVVAAGGAAAAAALVIAISGPLIERHEGTVLATYADPVGILTACVGHTGPELRRGQTFSKAQCGAIFSDDQRKVIVAMGRCTRVDVPVESYAALASFGFNAGAGTYCRKFAPLVNAGRLGAACARLSLYVYAAGRKLPGLVIRRARERGVCEHGLS